MRGSGRTAAIALSTLLLSACNQPQPAPVKPTVNPLDRVDSSRIKPIHFLNKTFTVKKYAQFQVEVPPHTAIPRIHGNFRSFIPRVDDDDLSDDSTDVSFLLMNPQQFGDYSRGHSSGTALYTVEATHDHEVEFVLPPTQDQPQKYYVVFTNLPGGPAIKHVQADFSLTFGY
jgi:hypothetical protein